MSTNFANVSKKIALVGTSHWNYLKALELFQIVSNAEIVPKRLNITLGFIPSITNCPKTLRLKLAVGWRGMGC